MLQLHFLLCLLLSLTFTPPIIPAATPLEFRLRVKLTEQTGCFGYSPFRFFSRGRQNKVKVIPFDHDFNHEVDRDFSLFSLQVKPEHVESDSPRTVTLHSGSFFSRRGSSPKPASLFNLPEVLVQEIFNFLHTDYSLLRSICKDSLKFYDKIITRTVRFVLPSRGLELISSYKLIELAEIILRLCKDNFFEYSHFKVDQSSDSRNNSLIFAERLRQFNPTEFYHTIAALLKSQVISWPDVEPLFLPQIEVFRKIYSLGLSIFARELLNSSPQLFLRTIGHEQENIVTVINNRQYHLAHFLIHYVHNSAPEIFSTQPGYLFRTIEELINADYWDLLEIVYIDNPSFGYIGYLEGIAERGSVQGLKIFEDLFKAHPQGIAHIAASEGHLDFLIQLDAFGILTESAGPDDSKETALHTAARFGHVDCLMFLVKALGPHWLDLPDNSGYLPIHMAVLSNSPGIIYEIIRLNPRYTHHSRIKSFFFGFVSPLHLAVSSNLVHSARVILEAFPELILVKNNRETLIHLAVLKASLDMLKLLLAFAPGRIIKARNAKGNTALHTICQFSNNIEVIATLLDTEQFTCLERNTEGLTAIGIFARRNPLYKVDYLLKVFRVDINTFYDALTLKI